MFSRNSEIFLAAAQKHSADSAKSRNPNPKKEKETTFEERSAREHLEGEKTTLTPIFLGDSH